MAPMSADAWIRFIATTTTHVYHGVLGGGHAWDVRRIQQDSTAKHGKRGGRPCTKLYAASRPTTAGRHAQR